MKKVLLDENLPVKLKYRLQDICKIYTVRDREWNALENGDLLKAMADEDFDYLITSDKISGTNKTWINMKSASSYWTFQRTTMKLFYLL